MRYLIFVTFLFFISNGLLTAQNVSCSGASPFCSGSTSSYPAGIGGGNAGLTYNGCLGSTPNPAWFTIPVTQSGHITIVISASFDVDFICFGPFSSPSGNCGNLDATTQVPNNSAAGSNGCSYSGSPTETLMIPNAQAGEYYTLLVTNFSGQSQAVNVIPNGTGGIGGMTTAGTPTICAGQSATIQVNPGTAIQSVGWSGPNGYLGPNYIENTGPLQTTTTFTVVGLSATGQSCAATQVVTVQPLPIPIISNNGPICANATAVFTVTGGHDYLWSGPHLFSYSSSGGTGTAAVVGTASLSNAQAVNMGYYTVIATLKTCTNTGTSYLTVKPNPTLTVSRSGNTCYGKSFSLLSNGATTYTWAGPNGFNFQGQNPLFINNNYPMSGSYQVIGSVNSCTGIATLDVTINPLPNVIASSSGSVCQSSTLTLTANGAHTYLWVGPNGYTSHQGTITIPNTSPSMAGTYSATGTDTNGCVATATLYQVVEPTPYVNIYSSDACVTKDIILNANGGATYQWSGPASFNSTLQNPVISNVSTFNGGAYNVTVTSIYGCSQTASIQSNVYQNPEISVLGSREVCNGKSFRFSAAGAVNYKWLNSGGIVTQDPVFSISSLDPSLQTSYTLVGTDGHFCSSGIPFYPIVNQAPAASLLPDLSSGCAPLCTSIKLNLLAKNVTDISWSYSDGEKIGSSTSTVQPKCFNSPGIYTVNVNLTDAKTCSNVITTTMQAFVSPKADFNYTPDKPTENDREITFSDASRNIAIQNRLWSFTRNLSGTKKDSSMAGTVTRIYTDVGSYPIHLKVVAPNGCMDSVVKILVISEDFAFFIPNAFTPNDDGLNDVFMPKTLAVKIYEFQVFNRWGQLLFSTTDPSKGWDGKKGGDTMAGDIYIYKCSIAGEDRNTKVYTGQFSLVR